MKRIFIVLFTSFIFYQANAQNLFVPDTFTYTINLDLSQNLYLKSVPVDLLKGFCKGDWNAYYPKKEMNQCLFDDFLQHFNYYQLNIPITDDDRFCLGSTYCDLPYFSNIYKQFTRKLKYKEVTYYDEQHSIIKREVLWLQVFYSREEADGWKHYEGPVFWMQEIKKSNQGVIVYNKNIRSAGWSLEKEFSTRGFIVNENQQKDDKKKINKYNNQVEEY